ncbi:MAG: hypothetical protein ACJAVR_000941 [Paracoccaceae bacterium]|jgi:hypothetical protein
MRYGPLIKQPMANIIRNIVSRKICFQAFATSRHGQFKADRHDSGGRAHAPPAALARL